MLSKGTIASRKPASWAALIAGRIPRTGRSVPSSDNSPISRTFSTSPLMIPAAIKYATAIGRSKSGPSFFRSAGANETTIFRLSLFGAGRPEFLIAALTRSFASSTAFPTNPTIQNEKRPLDKSASIVTMSPLDTLGCAVCVRAIDMDK